MKSISNGFSPRSILVCVSEGTFSDHAIRAGAELANAFHANLELIHAVQEPNLLTTRFDSTQVAAMVAEQVGRARTTILAHLAHSQHGLEVGGSPLEELLHVTAGPPAKRILDRAAEIDADLIVIGDSGKRRQLDFGGTARVILGKADCPVLVQTTPPRTIGRILVPVDLSQHSMSALETAIDLARTTKAKVTALNCFTVREYSYGGLPYGVGYAAMPALDAVRTGAREHFDEVMAGVDWKGVEHESTFAEEDPAAGVLARQDGFDLIVMGTHGRTGLAATLLGGVAYYVLRSAHTPVLAIRSPKSTWLLEAASEVQGDPTR